MRGFRKCGRRHQPDVRRGADWERNYILTASLQGLALGLFCFVSIYVYPDPFAEVAATSLTLATLVTIVGRNYGSPRMVVIFSVTFDWSGSRSRSCCAATSTTSCSA